MSTTIALPPTIATDLVPLTFDQLRQIMIDVYMTSTETTRGVSADDVAEGSILRGIFDGVAGPLEFLMFKMAVDLPKRYFLDQATGSNLDAIVNTFTFGQVTRVQSSAATGPLLFTGDVGTVIPQASQFTAPNGVTVSVETTGSIASGQTTVTLTADALVTGANTNLAPGTELTPVVSIAGLTSVTVPAQWTGGNDQQSDASLREAVVEFLDSIAKAIREAIVYGCRQNGYDNTFLYEPGVGQVWAYVDDGNPVNNTKLTICYNDVLLNWAAAGVNLKVLAPPDHTYQPVARVFSDGSVTTETLQANVDAAWRALDAKSRMGTGITRLDLINAAAAVPGYDGIDLNWPTTDLTVMPTLNGYGNQFGDGYFYPYERPRYAGVTWAN